MTVPTPLVRWASPFYAALMALAVVAFWLGPPARCVRDGVVGTVRSVAIDVSGPPASHAVPARVRSPEPASIAYRPSPIAWSLEP
ncbi:MAG: hypothetical protein ABL982_05225 [Vicinamibacterales bacterium]